jgi:hypothetical protein
VSVRILFLGLLLSFAGSTAFADDVIVGDPSACHLKIEYEAKEQMLHLRPTVPTDGSCDITPLMVQTALYQALDRQRGNPDLKLIFLGRLVDYPWLSNALRNYAMDNSGRLGFWNADTGRSVDGDDNAFVGYAIAWKFRGSMPPFGDVLAEHGYRVVGTSAEKVLVKPMTISAWPSFDSPPQQDLTGRFPFDALVHLRIAKVP